MKSVIYMVKHTIFNVQISCLKSVFDVKGETLLLSDLLTGDKFKDVVEAVRNEKDADKQKELKKNLPCYTPSGIFGSPVNAKNLQKHSGFICIDLDAKDNAAVCGFHELKDKIHIIPYVQYCGLSVRGNGFFCLIPIKDPVKHRAYFKALQRDFKNCGLTIDPSCSDVCRKRFVSYDPNPYVNTAAEVYDFTMPEYDKVERIVGGMTDETTREKVEELLRTLDEDEIDITESRQAWFEVLCAVANHFGEEGRGYAHRVSSHYAGYDFGETDGLYSDVLNHGGYGYTIASLFFHANKVLNSAEYQFKDVFAYQDELL